MKYLDKAQDENYHQTHPNPHTKAQHQSSKTLSTCKQHHACPFFHDKEFKKAKKEESSLTTALLHTFQIPLLIVYCKTIK